MLWRAHKRHYHTLRAPMPTKARVHLDWEVEIDPEDEFHVGKKADE